MGTHTPGPWTIEPEWRNREGGVVAIVNRDHAGDDWDVCEVHSTEANARLIAAAPKLLEALMAVIDEKAPAYHDCIDSGLDECAWCIARAAIAEATKENG